MRLSPLGWWTVGAVLALTGVRLVMAAIVPLSADEAYYWVWSRALAAGYPDHPPMVALWIRLGTWIAGPGTLGIRLLGPLAALLGSGLIGCAASDLRPGRGVGARAVLLFNATLLLGAGSVAMTPDTPLLFWSVACLAAVARALRSGRGAWWLAAGIALGAAGASKYTALFLPLGIGAALLHPALRHWWRSPWPWLGAAVAGAMVAPVLLWNADHGWVSLLRQGGRVGAWEPRRAVGFVGELIGGQIGLATPLVFVLMLRGVAAQARAARADPAAALLAALVVIPAVVFIEHALGDRVQGNWPGIVYPAAIIAAAALPGRAWRPAMWLGLALTALVYVQAASFILPLPPLKDPAQLRLAGWAELAGQAERARAAAGLGFIAADQYGIAAELAWQGKTTAPVIAAGERWRLFDLPAPAAGEAAGLLVQSARRLTDPDPAIWASAERIGSAARMGSGGVAEPFRLWRVVPRAGAPLVVLPRAGAPLVVLPRAGAPLVVLPRRGD